MPINYVSKSIRIKFSICSTKISRTVESCQRLAIWRRHSTTQSFCASFSINGPIALNFSIRCSLSMAFAIHLTRWICTKWSPISKFSFSFRISPCRLHRKIPLNVNSMNRNLDWRLNCMSTHFSISRHQIGIWSLAMTCHAVFSLIHIEYSVPEHRPDLLFYCEVQTVTLNIYAGNSRILHIFRNKNFSHTKF